MRRKELETKLINVKREFEDRIRSAPVPAFFAGVIAGVLIVLFRTYVGWLIFLGLAALGVMWLMAEADAPFSQSSVIDVPPESRTDENSNKDAD
ncbi:MAG TPA: hypothetical protein PLP17_11830 [Oligoflexia bacterium]|nr:hypothetical protein [Oligoflexia bacterium]